MNKTKDFYEKNYETYITNTSCLDMSIQYQFFLKHFNGKSILDIGFGSGRDMKYFSKHYDVFGIDSCKEFVSKMKSNNALHLDVLEMDFKDCFDGIWACASLLHVEKNNLNKAFINISNALKNNGVCYVSFKYGDFCGYIDGRYYINLNEEVLLNYLDNTNLFVIDTLITNDVSGRNQKWLNVILKKEK